MIIRDISLLHVKHLERKNKYRCKLKQGICLDQEC